MSAFLHIRFSATIRFTYGSQQGCGGTISVNGDGSQQIRSFDADNDNNYEPNLNCQWLVIGDPDKALQLSLTQFEVEQEANVTSTTCWDRMRC